MIKPKLSNLSFFRQQRRDGSIRTGVTIAADIELEKLNRRLRTPTLPGLVSRRALLRG